MNKKQYVCNYCNHEFNTINTKKITCPSCKDSNIKRIKLDIQTLNFYPDESKETKQELDKAFAEMLDWNID